MPPNLRRYQNTGDLHFVTFSCYQRRPFLRTAARRDIFLWSLERARQRFGFVVVGYVVMPEHVHLLISEPERESLATAIQLMKQTSSRLAHRQRSSRQMELFSDSDVRTPFWLARYYDFNVCTEKARIEKLKYLHRNPVTRGLCARPEDWRWSSYRTYAFGERGIVLLNQWPEIKLAA